MMMDAYKLTPPNIHVAPEIFSEVEVIHEVEDESQWMLWRGIHSDKWNNVPFVEATTRQYFVVESLNKFPVNWIHCTRVGGSYREGHRVVRRQIVSVNLDCNLAVAHLADPNVRDATGIDRIFPNDLNGSLFQPPATGW